MTASTQRAPGRATAAPEFRAPGVAEVALNTLRRLLFGPAARPARDAARDSLVLDAAVSIRAGRPDDASALLAPHGATLAQDPAYLNLLGVVCELRRQWKPARQFYGIAMSLDASYAPAQQNLRRLYELYTFGRTELPLALGDAELRRARNLNPKP